MKVTASILTETPCTYLLRTSRKEASHGSQPLKMVEPIYSLRHKDVEGSNARVGEVRLPHGIVPTPAFMPVGTQATVKAITPDQLRDTGASICLSNTFHLYLRPGAELVAAHGGMLSKDPILKPGFDSRLAT